MKYLLYVLIAICGTTASMAQSANSKSATTSWGKPFRGIQMSVSVANSVIPKSSSFIVTLEVTNSSTNILLVSETAPEGIFTVSLADEFGRTYQLTRSSHYYAQALTANIKPGQSRTWQILAGVHQYFAPPGLVPTKKDIPPGNYTLNATGVFRFKNGLFLGVESALKVQIK
jgi:hypothetical protein